MHKLRVYETVSDPVSREICGYLLVRGGVHARAYALALKHLTSVEMDKMLPIPNIPTYKIPEARRYMDEGVHRRLYRFGSKDYSELAAI
nr:manganese catalase family protein [Ochrobactrum vermis]